MLLHLFGALLALSTAPGIVPADSLPAGSVSGKVTSTDGTPLVDARVTVVEAGRSVSTGAEGIYLISGLPTGSYTLSYSAIGYAPHARRVTLSEAPLSMDVALKPSLVELPPLQVTSTPTATDPLSSPQPTAVIDGENLHAAQAPSLGETLNTVAGVHSLSTGAGIGKPVIRGLTSNRVLILDDGQRMETQQWGDEHGPNIETANADRIEVIRGPASVLYGSDALGGVVNVIPKALPTAEPGQSLLSGEATATYSSNTSEPDGALLLEGAHGNLGFRATLSGRDGGDVKTPDYTLWNSGNQALGGSLAVGTRGNWGNVTATFSQRNEKIELTDEDPAESPLQRIATSRARLDATFPLGTSRLEVTGGWEQNRRREFEDDVTDAVALGLLSRNYTLDGRWYHAPLGTLSGVLGVSGLRTTVDKFGEETLVPNTRVNGVGFFAFEQWHHERWDLSFGARYDYRSLDLADTTIAEVPDSRSWNSVTGNVGLLVKLAEPVALVANVGRGFRAPSSFELFANGVHEGTFAFERGNADLKTEKSLNTDVALRVQTSNIALEVGGFVNWISDFIYTVPTDQTDAESGFPVYDVTQGDARLQGVEAAAQYHPTRWLHFQGTADYVRGSNTSTGNPLPSMPPLRATYSVRLEGRTIGHLRDPYLLFGGETNGRQTRFDPQEAEFYAAAFDGAGYQSVGYTVMNAGLGFTLLPAPRDIHVDLLLRNLFDQRYANYLSRLKTFAEDPGQGRNLVLRVSSEF